MGMGYGANFALTVEETVLEKMAPEAMKILSDKVRETTDLLGDEALEEVSRPDFDMDDAIEVTNRFVDGLDEASTKDAVVLLTAIREVLMAFKAQTGMDLYAHLHPGDEYGDVYDDVNGIYFALAFADVFQETEQMKAAKENGADYDFSFFVTYG